MTNTLTWNFKSIQLPKLNNNLLSVISLIVLCTMTFIVIDTFADCCEELEQEYEAAEVRVKAALKAVTDAEAVYDALVEANADQELIDLAGQAVISARASLVLVVLDRIQIGLELLACYLSCPDESADSGSCDSGGCS